jgi:hypothetical protein
MEGMGRGNTSQCPMSIVLAGFHFLSAKRRPLFLPQNPSQQLIYFIVGLRQTKLAFNLPSSDAHELLDRRYSYDLYNRLQKIDSTRLPIAAIPKSLL